MPAMTLTTQTIKHAMLISSTRLNSSMPNQIVTIDPRTTDNFLYNRKDDPGQINNLWDCHPDCRQKMLIRLKNLLIEEGCPEEQLDRLDLSSI